TQWKVLSTSDPNGGAFFHAYMESTNGGTPTFWVGQNAVQTNGGGAFLTYPRSMQVAASYPPGAPGTIPLIGPATAVPEPGAAHAAAAVLYSVTSSTMTL